MLDDNHAQEPRIDDGQGRRRPGKSKSTAGLTFVCLSRAKCLVDLLIESMPLERLSKIGDTPTFQMRLREEVRLNALAGETLRLHRGVE